MTQHVSHRDSDVIHELRVEVEQLKARVASVTSIMPHELAALRELVRYTRALAGVIGNPTDENSRKMKIWAQMVEELIERMERK